MELFADITQTSKNPQYEEMYHHCNYKWKYLIQLKVDLLKCIDQVQFLASTGQKHTETYNQTYNETD